MSHLYIVCELLLFHLLFNNVRDVRKKEQKKVGRKNGLLIGSEVMHSLSKQYMRLVDSHHNCDFNFDLKL